MKENKKSDYKPSYGITVIENGFLVSLKGGVTFVSKLSEAFAIISSEQNLWANKKS